jgi:hypothetical protein
MQPIWTANADVINIVDTGFLGAWGEWHTSSNGNDNKNGRITIMTEVLKAVPNTRMVMIRRPDFKREFECGTFTCKSNYVTSSNAFSKINISRIGHLNDCFLSSSDDVGTYGQSGTTIMEDKDYIGNETFFVPHGGESCALVSDSLCPNALSTLTKLHTNYLNIDYFPGVINRWKTDGCFNEIEKRLGYRFVLTSATFPDAILSTSSTLSFSFSIRNDGFGHLFNPRPIYILLWKGSSFSFNNATITKINNDPRRWTAGLTHLVSVSIPFSSITFPIGSSISVGVWLPEAEGNLNTTSSYSVRFANVNTWDNVKGVNILGLNLIPVVATKITHLNVIDNLIDALLSNSN